MSKLCLREVRFKEYESAVLAGLKKLKIRQYQMDFLRDYSYGRLILKSRQLGFSWIFGLEGVCSGLLYGINALFASASQTQSELCIAYASLHLQQLGIVPVSESASRIVLPNGAYLVAMPKNFRTIQGFAGDVYFDEFAWNADAEAIWQALVPAITAIDGRVTVASTPFAKRGMFYDLWTSKTEGNEYYTKKEIDIYTALKQGMGIGKCKTVEEFLHKLKSLLVDADMFPSAYECKFVDDNTSYIPFSLIDPLMLLDADEDTKEDLVLGIDIGRHQDITDITAVGENNGIYEIKFNISLEKQSYDDQRDFINALFKQYNIVKANIDRTGIGDSIYEAVKKKNPHKVTGVWFSQKRKEQMAVRVKKLMQNGKLKLLKCRKCAHHYVAIKRTATERGFKYDTENGARSKVFGHADKFWSLALALALVKEEKRKMKGKRH